MLSLHREYLKCWHPVLTLASFRSHRGLTFVHDVTWMFFVVLLALRQTYKPYHQILCWYVVYVNKTNTFWILTFIPEVCYIHPCSSVCICFVFPWLWFVLRKEILIWMFCISAISSIWLLFYSPLSYLQYGEVLNVIVSSKKKGSAVVEFATVRAAVSI